MDHMFTRGWEDLLGRADGPLHFRLIMQPIVAVLLAIRAGLKDAREGRPLFFWAIVLNPVERRSLIRQGWKDVGRLFIVALIMDAIYQLIVLHRLYPGEMLIVATALALVPYLMVRGLTNRIAPLLHRRQPQDCQEPAPLIQQTRAKANSGRSRHLKQVAIAGIALVLVYLLAAYILVPFVWIRYAHRHPSLDAVPTITQTRADIPGDPLNVALIGTETEVKKIMLDAKWYPADPLTLRSCLEIAEATVLKRPDDDAPVSNLYLFGRKQDLAFEQPVGDNPRQRHHVRFWRSDVTAADGRPVWVGSATYDKRVGLSHTTGQITHHIAPDIDAERDHLFHYLEQTGELSEVYTVHGFQKELKGRNGGGDPWHTDGNLWVGIIAATP